MAHDNMNHPIGVDADTKKTTFPGSPSGTPGGLTNQTSNLPDSQHGARIPTITWGPLLSNQSGNTNSADEFTAKGDIEYETLNRRFFTDNIEFNKFYRSARDFVLARMGHPIVRVEVGEFQIATAIDEAISRLDYHAPDWCTSLIGFETSSGTSLYQLPSYIMNNFRYIAYKKDLLSIPLAAGSLESDFFIKYFQDNFLFSDFQISDFYILKSYLKTVRKVLGKEGSFKVLNGNYINISPAPHHNETVLIEYKTLNTNTLHHYFINWIHRYSLVVVKEILGQIRGKYAVLPSPDGGARLNGEALIQQAKEEKAELLRELYEEIEEPPMFSTY